MTAIDSGTRLWDTVSQRPLDELILRDETREQLRRTLFLQPLPFVRRVIFIATPHRGSYEAGSWIAHQVAGFASLPKGFVDVMKDLVTGNPSVVTLSLGGLPRSINDMTPGNPFVQALASTPVAPGVADPLDCCGERRQAARRRRRWDRQVYERSSGRRRVGTGDPAPDTPCRVTRSPSPRCAGSYTGMEKMPAAQRASAAQRIIASTG